MYSISDSFGEQLKSFFSLINSFAECGTSLVIIWEDSYSPRSCWYSVLTREWREGRGISIRRLTSSSSLEGHIGPLPAGKEPMQLVPIRWSLRADHKWFVHFFSCSNCIFKSSAYPCKDWTRACKACIWFGLWRRVAGLWLQLVPKTTHIMAFPFPSWSPAFLCRMLIQSVMLCTLCQLSCAQFMPDADGCAFYLSK